MLNESCDRKTVATRNYVSFRIKNPQALTLSNLRIFLENIHHQLFKKIVLSIVCGLFFLSNHMHNRQLQHYKNQHSLTIGLSRGEGVGVRHTHHTHVCY